MAIVYRFEDAQQKGPYGNGGSDAYDREQRTLDPSHSCCDMPTLYSTGEDGSPAATLHRDVGCAGYHFGFTSLAQLKRAFPSSVGRAAMGGWGIKLLKMEVPDSDVLRGNAQCIFKRHTVTDSTPLDLKTLKEHF